MPWEGLSPEQRKVLLREMTAELERRKKLPPQQWIAELEAHVAELKAKQAGASNGRTDK